MPDGGLGRFATTVHVLLSAVLKLMRVVRIPAGLALYRGLGGRLDLPSSFKEADGDGLYGYVPQHHVEQGGRRPGAPRLCVPIACGARIPFGSVLGSFCHLTRTPCLYTLTAESCIEHACIRRA